MSPNLMGSLSQRYTQTHRAGSFETVLPSHFLCSAFSDGDPYGSWHNLGTHLRSNHRGKMGSTRKTHTHNLFPGKCNWGGGFFAWNFFSIVIHCWGFNVLRGRHIFFTFIVEFIYFYCIYAHCAEGRNCELWLDCGQSSAIMCSYSIDL